MKKITDLMFIETNGMSYEDFRNRLIKEGYKYHHTSDYIGNIDPDPGYRPAVYEGYLGHGIQILRHSKFENCIENEYWIMEERCCYEKSIC